MTERVSYVMPSTSAEADLCMDLPHIWHFARVKTGGWPRQKHLGIKLKIPQGKDGHWFVGIVNEIVGDVIECTIISEQPATYFNKIIRLRVQPNIRERRIKQIEDARIQLRLDKL